MPKLAQTAVSILIDLMGDYQLNLLSLSKEINPSYTSVRQMVLRKFKITIPTALRLTKYFSQTPYYLLDFQRNVEMKEAENNKELMTIVKGITKVKKPVVNANAQEKTAGKTTIFDRRKNE